MKISIAERLRPFSHVPGTKFLLPKTSLCVQIFPTRLYFNDLKNTKRTFTITLDLKGPITNFTAELDLEKGWIRVFGMTQEGFMRFYLQADESGVWLKMEKTPREKVRGSWLLGEEFCLAKEERVLLDAQVGLAVSLVPRLSLGMHKLQDFDQVRKRRDLKEIFPHVLQLASFVPTVSTHCHHPLLMACWQAIENEEKEKLSTLFEHIFCACFEGVLTPRWIDSDHQGIIEELPQDGCPLHLLAQIAACMRALFFQESAEEIALLPSLPPQFHAGRLINLQTAKGPILDLEWSKKRLKKVIITPNGAHQITLKVPKGIHSLRYNGKRHAVANGKILVSLDRKRVCVDRLES